MPIARAPSRPKVSKGFIQLRVVVDLVGPPFSLISIISSVVKRKNLVCLC